MPGLNVPHFDLSPSLDYSKFEVAFETLLRGHTSVEEVYEQVGRQVIGSTFADTCPEVYDLLLDVRAELAHEGAAILHNTGTEKFRAEISQLTTLAISSVFGNPTRTDQKDQRIVWPIHYDPDTPLERTYSQSLGEAAFHTDTQYFTEPERFFGMYCVVADVPGKGTSELIDGNELVATYRERHGDKALSVLGRNYPFKVPSVFTKRASDEDLEVTWAPIYDSEDRMIRYRHDTITDALRLTGSQIDDDQQNAIDRIEELLAEIEPVRYHLMPGDAVLIDNHRVLHARTAFDDPERLLYRVRMNADE